MERRKFFFGKSGFKGRKERFFKFFEKKSERAADYEDVGFLGFYDIDKTKRKTRNKVGSCFGSC